MRSFTSLEVFMGAILSIEEGVFFNDHCSIRCTEKITIGRDTMFGDGVRILIQIISLTTIMCLKLQ